MPGLDLVSCVIPVYNAERFIDETVRSVLAQSHSRIEIIAVDDGSADRSGERLAAYSPRVRVIRQRNLGEAAARNAGVRAATGTFVAFLDADDLWEQDKITRQLSHIRESPEIDLSFTRFRNFWAAGMEDEARQFEAHALAQPLAAWSIGTLLTRRDSFEKFGPFDEGLRQLPNMTWFVHAARQGARIDVLPEVLMRRRLHANNASRANAPVNADEWLPMVKAWRDFRRSGARSRS
jgi:glycosyltransferase involved in cell wall biosynthesis